MSQLVNLHLFDPPQSSGNHCSWALRGEVSFFRESFSPVTFWFVLFLLTQLPYSITARIIDVSGSAQRWTESLSMHLHLLVTAYTAGFLLYLTGVTSTPSDEIFEIFTDLITNEFCKSTGSFGVGLYGRDSGSPLCSCSPTVSPVFVLGTPPHIYDWFIYQLMLKNDPIVLCPSGECARVENFSATGYAYTDSCTTCDDPYVSRLSLLFRNQEAYLLFWLGSFADVVFKLWLPPSCSRTFALILRSSTPVLHQMRGHTMVVTLSRWVCRGPSWMCAEFWLSQSLGPFKLRPK